MKCRCGAELGHVNRKGEPMLRNRGLVFHADAPPSAICPKCKAEVPMANDMAKALSDRLVLFFKGGSRAAK